MEAKALVSVEEYLNTSYRPDCDYVDGELVERNVGEFDHADLQTEIASYLRTRYRGATGCEIELRLPEVFAALE